MPVLSMINVGDNKSQEQMSTEVGTEREALTVSCQDSGGGGIQSAQRLPSPPPPRTAINYKRVCSRVPRV